MTKPSILSRVQLPRARMPPVEYFCLHHVKPAGKVIAAYNGQDITDVIMDEHGYRYIYAGLAPRKFDGNYDVAPLKAGEVILEPGLLYQLIPVKRSLIS